MSLLFVNHLICFSILAAVLPFNAALSYFSRPKHILNRIFAAYMAVIAWWGLFTILMITAPSKGPGFLWDRLCLSGAIFIPTTFFHFVSVYTRRYQRLKVFIWLSYALSFCFLLALWSSRYFIVDVRPKFGLNYFSIPGPLYLIFIFFFASCVIGAVISLWLSARYGHTEKIRQQSKILFWLSVIGYTGGGANYLLVYDVNVPFLFEIANYGVVVHGVAIPYIIFRYRFLDIEVIIKKTLVFAGLFGFVAGTVSLVVYLLNTYLATFIGINNTLATGAAIVIAILLYDPVKSLLVNLTDHYLFQKKEDFRKILNRLSGKIITILDLDRVAETILETFKDSLRAETGVILLKDERGFQTLNSFGLEGRGASKTYPAEDPLIQHFARDPQIIHLASDESSASLPVLVLARLEAFKAAVAIPLFLHGELIGVVALGKKKSDQEYGQDEIEYFPTVAGQVSIALSNARLYHESILARKRIEEMQLELIHRQKMAFVADLVKGLAHEIFNPLLPVFHTLEALERDTLVGLYQVFKAEKASLQPQSRQDYFKHLQDLNTGLETLRESTRHIHLVIDTLEKMQKEDKETIGPFDFKTFLKDSGALIGVELHGGARQVATREEVPRGLPPVKGNPTLLAQVFVNLYKNAIHAMERSLERKITIKALVDPQDPGFLKIDFSDTGSGIPADILPKIFDFGFTTKGKKGQGIGLNQCKLIIEKFGGSIQCTSQGGKGTTFALRLPIYKEVKSDSDFNRR